MSFKAAQLTISEESRRSHACGDDLPDLIMANEVCLDNNKAMRHEVAGMSRAESG